MSDSTTTPVPDDPRPPVRLDVVIQRIGLSSNERACENPAWFINAISTVVLGGAVAKVQNGPDATLSAADADRIVEAHPKWEAICAENQRRSSQITLGSRFD